MLQSTSIESLFGFSTSADTLLLLHPTTVFRPYPLTSAPTVSQELFLLLHAVYPHPLPVTPTVVVEQEIRARSASTPVLSHPNADTLRQRQPWPRQPSATQLITWVGLDARLTYPSILLGKTVASSPHYSHSTHLETVAMSNSQRPSQGRLYRHPLAVRRRRAGLLVSHIRYISCRLFPFPVQALALAAGLQRRPCAGSACPCLSHLHMGNHFMGYVSAYRVGLRAKHDCRMTCFRD